jgi:hypothetical protein
MRPDQRLRLQAIADRLIEQTIMDADPDNWSGAGKTLRDMDKETRGDALWCRKIAVQTTMLMLKVEQLSTDPAASLGKNKADDDDVDRAIVRAEAEAAKLMDRVQKKVAGAAGGK